MGEEGRGEERRGGEGKGRGKGRDPPYHEILDPPLCLWMHASAIVIMTDMSVCSSVCLSPAGIISKRMHLSSNSLHHLVGT